jgi:hypothetical protein
MSSLASVLLLAALAAPAAADAPHDPDALARGIAPYLEDRSAVVLHLDLSALDAAAVADAAGRLTGMEAGELAPFRKTLEAGLTAFRQAGGRDVYVVFSLADLLQEPYLIVPVPAGTNVRNLRKLLHRRTGGGTTTEPIGGSLFLGSKTALARLRENRPMPRPELARAFEAAGPSVAQAVLLPAGDVRRTLEEVMPTLPADLGGGDVKELTRGLQWAALGVQLKPTVQARLVLQSPDEASARALRGFLVRLLQALAKQKWLRERVPNAEQLVSLLTPEIRDSRLTRTLDQKALAGAVRPIVQRERERLNEQQPVRGLGTILRGLHDYERLHGRFPAAAIYDKQGKPLLSWRVQILPYLGHQKVYEQFHLDESWDSEHNRKLIEQMPAVFRGTNAKLTEAGKTPFLAPRGPATMFPDGKGLRIADVTDGVSNTIFLVIGDDAHAVVWTKPADLDYDPKAPSKGLAVGERGLIWVGLVDGAARGLARDIPADKLRALFSRNGGEPAGEP